MTALETLPSIFVERWPVILTSLLALFLALIVSNVLRSNPLANVPLVGEDLGNAEKRRKEYLKNGKNLYLTGYKKVRRLWSRVCNARSTD